MSEVTWGTLALSVAFLIGMLFLGEITGNAVLDTTTDLSFDDDLLFDEGDSLLNDDFSGDFHVKRQDFTSLFDPKSSLEQFSPSGTEDITNTSPLDTVTNTSSFVNTTPDINTSDFTSFANTSPTTFQNTSLLNTSTTDRVSLNTSFNLSSTRNLSPSLNINTTLPETTLAPRTNNVTFNNKSQETFSENPAPSEPRIVPQEVSETSLQRVTEKRKETREEHDLAQEHSTVRKTYERVDQGTAFTVRFEPEQTLYDVRIYENIPKSVAAHVDDIVFIGPQPEVVEADPLVVWHFPQVEESLELQYQVQKDVDELDELPETIELVGSVEQRSPSRFPLFRILGMILAFFFGASIVIIAHVERKE